MILKIIVLLSYIFMIVMNYLANALPFGGNTTGYISGKYPTMFTPSGFTFSIWGLIYVMVTLFVVMMFVNDKVVIGENQSMILYAFIGLNILNGLWLLFWHNDMMVISTIVIILMLVSLLYIIVNLPDDVSITKLTFGIYAGWISVATIANISILLYKSDFALFMNYELIWFVIILVIGIAIGLVMALKYQYYVYSLVYVWAYFGILMRYIR